MISHTDVLAVIGEGPGAVAVIGHRPHVGLGETPENAVGHVHIGTVVIVSIVNARESFRILRVINHNLITICNRSGGGTAQNNLIGGCVAQLEGILKCAHRGGDGDHIAHLHGPFTLYLFTDHSLVELNGIGAVGDSDIGVGILTIVVKNLRDRHVLKGHIGADIGGSQFSDGLDHRSQCQPRGFFIGAAVQLRQAVIFLPLSGGNDRVAQGDVLEVIAHTGADRARLVLEIDVLSVQQGDHTLDGQIRSV